MEFKKIKAELIKDLDDITIGIKYNGAINLMNHNLYVFSRKSKELKKHILFRNYLNSNREAIESYNKIKIKASKLFPNDINKYTEYKNLYLLEIYKNLNLL